MEQNPILALSSRKDHHLQMFQNPSLKLWELLGFGKWAQNGRVRMRNREVVMTPHTPLWLLIGVILNL